MMDTRTGRIVSQEEVLRMSEIERAHFVPVPAKLTRQARRLMERNENANLESGPFAELASRHKRGRSRAKGKKPPHPGDAT